MEPQLIFEGFHLDLTHSVNVGIVCDVLTYISCKSVKELWSHERMKTGDTAILEATFWAGQAGSIAKGGAAIQDLWWNREEIDAETGVPFCEQWSARKGSWGLK